MKQFVFACATLILASCSEEVMEVSRERAQTGLEFEIIADAVPVAFRNQSLTVSRFAASVEASLNKLARTCLPQRDSSTRTVGRVGYGGGAFHATSLYFAEITNEDGTKRLVLFRQPGEPAAGTLRDSSLTAYAEGTAKLVPNGANSTIVEITMMPQYGRFTNAITEWANSNEASCPQF